MKKIGVVFSAFDFIHPGHMRMLEDAKNQCDYLIAGIQTDPTTDVEYRAQTGSKNKPIYTTDERVEMIKGIRYVDEYFTYHTEQDLYDWLINNDWHVRILGSDWRGKPFTGHDINKGTIYFHERIMDCPVQNCVVDSLNQHNSRHKKNGDARFPFFSFPPHAWFKRCTVLGFFAHTTQKMS